jgi:soluble lytic murein transglycosylase-like protein
MIGDLLSTAARAQKLDIASIQRGIQDGVIPSYIGIPLLQQKMQERTEAAQMLAGKQAQNQPPIAQQVMSQAQQMTQPQAAPAMQQPQMQQPAEPGGIDQAQSNLPQAGFAGGGIVAFDDGGNVSMDPFADEDLSEEDMEDQQMDQDLMSDRQFAYAPESMAAPTYNEMSYSRDSSSMKEPGQPEHGVAHEEISAKGKRGLEDLLDLIKHKESRGRDYDTKGNPLTSPVGAKYAMQVMPATARDPGFGIKPAQSDSPDEYNRVGRELYSKLLDKYGDPKLAAIAYNMGPGKTDKWLSSGADMATLPSESRQYAQGFKEGGVAHFVVGGSTQDQIDADRRAMKTFGLNMLQPAAALGDAWFGNPVNSVSSKISGIANAIGIPRAGRALGIYDPDVTSVGLPTVGSGSRTPYLDMLRQAKQNINEPKPSFGKFDAVTGDGWDNQASAEQDRLAKIYQAQKSAGQTAMGNNVNLGSVTGSDLSAAYDPENQATQAAAQPETTQSISEKDDQSGGIEALFSQQAADNKKQREINNYLALMSAGFGMMGGSSPYAFQNIGKGAQQGVATLAELNKGVGDDERALMNARISAQNAKARNDYYQAALEERKRAALSGEDIKKETQADKVTIASSRIIQKMQEDATNKSRLVTKSRIDAAAKDLANPMSDEQRTHIYEDEKARALAHLNINPIFVYHSKIAIPGYDPSAVNLNQGDEDVVSKYLKPKS